MGNTNSKQIEDILYYSVGGKTLHFLLKGVYFIVETIEWTFRRMQKGIVCILKMFNILVVMLLAYPDFEGRSGTVHISPPPLKWFGTSPENSRTSP